MDATVTITVLEYEALLNAQRWCDALTAAGVDNWDGYDVAIAIYNEDE